MRPRAVDGVEVAALSSGFGSLSVVRAMDHSTQPLNAAPERRGYG
jgi:hypothetical protein